MDIDISLEPTKKLVNSFLSGEINTIRDDEERFYLPKCSIDISIENGTCQVVVTDTAGNVLMSSRKVDVLHYTTKISVDCAPEISVSNEYKKPKEKSLLESVEDIRDAESDEQHTLCEALHRKIKALHIGW